ncbi:hypothetical protein PG994_002453 [Apiospora phragmitis]|uniref:Zn(2)-C6 fungal-type domain-containing protein n=1 Tax=Apiospora phragmitis TaxID=2905665 RepID=A0ABR1WWD7_9PEZI
MNQNHKCGGELPTCQNCAKSKRVCTGYQRQHACILSQSMAVAGSAQSNGQSLLQSEPGSGLVMISWWRAAKSNPLSRAAKIGHLSPEMLAMPIRLPQEVSSQRVYRSRLISLMVENDAPFDGENSRAYQTFGDRYDWSLHVLNLPSLTPALEHALLAMSTARLGRHTGRPALTQESLKLYAQSVAQVRRGILLHDKSAALTSEQSLAACLSLLWYETIECPGKSMMGYQAHYMGCLELLRMRGAGAYSSGLAHCTLQILRLHTISKSSYHFAGQGGNQVIFGNDPGGITFLAQPEWLHLPWSSPPVTKSLFDRLLDILLQLPRLAAQFEALHTAAGPQHALRRASDITKEGQRTEDALEDWLRSFRAALPGGDGALYRAELLGARAGRVGARDGLDRRHGRAHPRERVRECGHGAGAA